MTDYTVEQYREAAKRAYAAGDIKSAEELAQAGMALEKSAPQPQAAPQDDGWHPYRAIAQGALMGFSDEINAAGRAAGSWMTGGNETYDSALADERQKLNDYKNKYPVQSAIAEIGGAAIPMLAAAPFTGGASVAPTLGRAMVEGAAYGGLYGVGTGEGGVADRVANIPVGAATGAIGGAVGRAATGLASKAVKVVQDAVGTRAAVAVREELKRLATEAGLTADEIVQRVADGQMMAGMSDTLKYAARRIKAQGGEASTVISTAIGGRPGPTRERAMASLQGALTPGTEGSVVRAVRGDQQAAREAEDAAYASIWNANPGPASPDVAAAMAQVLQRDPSAASVVAKNLQLTTGKSPFFSIAQDGSVKFTRPPTLQEAEIVRRTLKDQASSAWQAGQGTTGEAYGTLEGGLRSAIDTSSPELAAQRASAAGLRTARDAFEAGRKALGGRPEDVMLEFDKVLQQGDDAVKAYRAGMMDTLRAQATGAQRGALMGALSDQNSGKGQVLSYVLSPEQRDAVMKNITNAANAQETANVVMRGSQTAQTMAPPADVAGMAGDLIAAKTGHPGAIARLIGRMFGPRQLTPAEMTRVAKMMTTLDPAIIENALKSGEGFDKLKQTVAALIARASVGSGASSPQVVGKQAPLRIEITPGQ